ncbi:MAG: hypothetical protein CMA65_04010 [Euryarchaeota archaeon]|nr:hypothetical protein [Euryarchaeota archaeon]
MSGYEVEIIQLSLNFRLFNGRIFSDFKFHTQASIFTVCSVQNVNTQLCGHVKAVIWADVNTHLTRRTSFPNNPDSSVVVSWNEEPRLHVLKTFVGVLDGLGLPKRWLQVRSHPIRSELLTSNVVHRSRRGSSSSASIIQKFRVGCVVVVT